MKKSTTSMILNRLGIVLCCACGIVFVMNCVDAYFATEYLTATYVLIQSLVPGFALIGMSKIIDILEEIRDSLEE